MLSIDAFFCHVDDFCQIFEPQWRKQLIAHGLQTRQRSKGLCLSEIMTILIVLIAYSHQQKKPSLEMDWILPQSA